jgi:uncharacterized protein (DUF2235 family)
MKGKRLITCSDGTWNKPNSVDNGSAVQTNVQKIFDKILLRDANNTLQIKYYDEGVGAEGNRFERIFDGATGKGIDENILDAYKFITWNYEPGDEIYLFGFSRGAYTARSLAGLIRKCGIIKKNDLDLIGKAYNLYRNKDVAPKDTPATSFRQANSYDVTHIKFIGVWDTVGALGVPLKWFQWDKKKYKFHDTTLSSIVQYAYHALAIDEQRGNFKPALWKQSMSKSKDFEQTMEQRWFAGAHSNVGGGYPNAGLSNIALTWMMEKAEGTGLAFEDGWRNVIPVNKPWDLVNSRDKWYYKLTKKYEREITSLADIDSSVRDRMNEDPKYQPQNVLKLMRGEVGS